MDGVTTGSRAGPRGQRWSIAALALLVLSIIAKQEVALSQTTDTTDAPSTKRTTAPPPPPPSPGPSQPKTSRPYYDNETGVEYPSYDGWFNNPANPGWGGADTPLFRRVPPAYSDGVYEPSGVQRPNPLDISLSVFNGTTGLPSYRNRTALLVFFGQQVVEEILDAQRAGCPPEYINLHIPKGHPQYDPDGVGGKELPLLRTRHDMTTGYSPNNPRQQLSEISPWIDGTLVYGPNKAWADTLRSFKDGLLAATNDSDVDSKARYFPAYNDVKLPMINPPTPREHKLKPVKRFYKLGNARGNENPFLLTFGILWFRLHNLKARQLKAAHADWNDEKLFNEARKRVVATYQKLVVYDWIPSWLNASLGGYKDDGGYDPSVHPGISHEFQSAAMRFGHTLVPPGVYRRNAKCEFRKTTDVTGFAGHSALRTCNTFWNPQEAVNETDIDEILMGMASQITEREDMIITPDLRGNVFGPLEFSRRDLMAINIQRGRDHGIPDYNTVRAHYGLPRITEWRDINWQLYEDDPGIFERIRKVYKDDLNNLDLWPAGLLETTQDGPGPIFTAIILDQFRRIRKADRFWYENYKLNKLFTEEEVAEINRTTLHDIIVQVTQIKDDHIQENPFFWLSGDPCEQPEQLSAESSNIKDCTKQETYDYFSGSAWPYIVSFTVLGLSLLLSIAALFFMVKLHDKEVEREGVSRRALSKRKDGKDSCITAVEWIGVKEGTRNVKVKFSSSDRKIYVQNENGKNLRTIDLSFLTVPDRRGHNYSVRVALSADDQFRMINIGVPKEYDLILELDDGNARDKLLTQLKTFLGKVGVDMEDPTTVTRKMMKVDGNTREDRQKLLEKFFREIFAKIFERKPSERRSAGSSKVPKEILRCELTKVEFAESLRLTPDSLFVENMFNLIDKDGNGYISFREFLDVMVIFSKGTAEEKAKLMFDMYDLEGKGTLSKEEFKVMLKSLIDIGNEKIESSNIEELVESVFNDAGFEGKEELSVEDFNRLLGEFSGELNYASLDFDGAAGRGQAAVKPVRENITRRAQRTLLAAYKRGGAPGGGAGAKNKRLSRFDKSGDSVRVVTTHQPVGRVAEWTHEVTRFVGYYRLQIFWCTLYTLVNVGIFVERAYYYSVEREHTGLRQIAGYGVTVTRGAASGMMFTYACLLVTMCRNTITKLRETFLHRYIPFDSAITFHKYIAYMALFFTLMHVIGHAINFYHISTQTAPDLNCLFRNFYHATDELPKFHYWCWETITGFTGVLLTILVFVMYTFAVQYARRHAFRAFWITHNMWSILFILMVLHGAGRLVQPPFFQYFAIGPVFLFVVDRLVSISRMKVEIPVVRADLLPSEVIYLECKRPLEFEYKSGQWVRIAVIAQGESEYHPFTIASAPHEENIGLYIRAVGPWTMNLRRTYDQQRNGYEHMSKVFLDGPYGEGHQEWYKYEVAVLVGGGIGVTPFASILKDLVHRSESTSSTIRCKKVYFIWVTRTQRQFEWMTDIIREVEVQDQKNLVSVHIFITQFKQKFDIRTTMLYICERYFQKISGRSLFSGLQSITHFGRPDFESFLDGLRTEHQQTSVFGVFSCGPPPMTASVEKACANVNSKHENVMFQSHSENF